MIVVGACIVVTVLNGCLVCCESSFVNFESDLALFGSYNIVKSVLIDKVLRNLVDEPLVDPIAPCFCSVSPYAEVAFSVSLAIVAVCKGVSICYRVHGEFATAIDYWHELLRGGGRGACHYVACVGTCSLVDVGSGYRVESIPTV